MLDNLLPFVGLCIAVLIAIFGAVMGGNRYLLGQFQKQMDVRFELAEQSRQTATVHWESRFNGLEKSAQTDQEQWRRVEREVLILKADLPERYLRREDFILHQTRIEAKLDGLALKIENAQLRGERNG